MRSRLLVHVAGGPGSGKTTFVERLLDADLGLATCVRGIREKGRGEELALQGHGELQRYRAAGAGDVGQFRFTDDGDELFESDVMQDYSDFVIIEGDHPLDFADLFVHVASPPPNGCSLLRRVERDHAAEREESIRELERALESP